MENHTNDTLNPPVLNNAQPVIQPAPKRIIPFKTGNIVMFAVLVCLIMAFTWIFFINKTAKTLIATNPSVIPVPSPSFTPTPSGFPLPTLPIDSALRQQLYNHEKPFDTIEKPLENTIYLGQINSLPALFFTIPKFQRYYLNGEKKTDPHKGLISIINGGMAEGVDFRHLNQPKIVYQDRSGRISFVGNFKYGMDQQHLVAVISFKDSDIDEVARIDLKRHNLVTLWPKEKEYQTRDPLSLFDYVNDKYLLLAKPICSFGDGMECTSTKDGSQYIVNLTSNITLEIPGNYGDISIHPQANNFTFYEQVYKKVYVGKECMDKCDSSGCVIDSHLYHCESSGFGEVWINQGEMQQAKLP